MNKLAVTRSLFKELDKAVEQKNSILQHVLKRTIERMPRAAIDKVIQERLNKKINV